MLHAVRYCVAALLICLAPAWVHCPAKAQAADAPEELRDWKPEDSVQLRYYSGSMDYLPGRFDPIAGNNPVLVGPDGRYFLVVSHFGDVAKDETVYEIEIWGSQAVREALSSGRAAPAPLRKLRFSSASSSASYPALSQVRFDSSGASILMRAVDPQGVLNAFRFDIGAGQLVQLTHHDHDIVDFAYARDVVIFSADSTDGFNVSSFAAPMEPLKIDRSDRITSFATQALWSQAWNDWRHAAPSYIERAGSKPIPLKVQLNDQSIDYGLSRNGRFAVGMIEDPERGRSIALLDFETGDLKMLSPSPAIRWPQVAWSSDGRRLMLAGVKGRTDNWRGDVIVLELPTGKIDQVGPNDADRYANYLRKFDNSFRTADLSRRTGISLRTVMEEPTTALKDLKLDFKQDANTPPVLIASNRTHTLALTTPDPLLNRVWWAKSKPFTWSEEGHSVTGGLWLPRNYNPGQRLPLVIQPYYYWPTMFLPDGPFAGTVDSAQSLVARGFAVLQIDMLKKDSSGKVIIGVPEEVGIFVKRIDAAIGALSEKGLIDPNRVGLSGFSRGGIFTHFAITHPGRYPLAAAIVNDSHPVSYSYFVLGGNTNDTEPYSTPFWANKPLWLELEPSFNADRVRTPVLFTNNLSGGFKVHPVADDDLSQIRSPIGALVMNKKPVDSYVFPHGDHHLQKPSEIIALHNLALDWMSFWLKGEAPKDPERAARWAPLRKLQEDVLATPRKPDGKWIFVPEENGGE